MSWSERYVSVAGGGAHDGTTEADAWTLAEAIAAVAAGQRVNVKAGTHTAAADRTFGTSGTDASAIWWRGYNSTIGDLETSNTLADFPLIQVTGAGSQNLFNGAYNWFSDVKFESASTTANVGTMHMNAVGCRVHHCLIENVAANSASLALSFTGTCDGFIVTRCRIISTTTSTYSTVIANGATTAILGCWFEGAGVFIGTSPGMMAFNVFDDVGGVGISVNGLGVSILNNSFYSCGGDAIVIAAAANSCLIANNIISEGAAYGINSSAAASSAIHIVNNLFYSNSSGNLNNILESQLFGSITDDSASPYTNAASDDFSLKATSNGKGAGFPGVFLGETATGYPDVGAVQRQESGGVIIRPSAMQGGF